MIERQHDRKQHQRERWIVRSILLFLFVLVGGTTLLVAGVVGLIPWPSNLTPIVVGAILPVLAMIISLSQWLHSLSSHPSEPALTPSHTREPFPVSPNPSSFSPTPPITAQASSLISEKQLDIPGSLCSPEPVWKVPTAFTPLLGRARDVSAVRALLKQAEVHLLTLLGPGGIGKTRLAIQLATDMCDTFPDGVCFVPLAAISDPTLVVPTIAQELGLQESRAQPIFEQLKRWLRDKHFLLLLDNFEHVVMATPQVEELLAACPSLKILATSRAVLHIQGEQEFLVPPLALPDLDHLPAHETLSQYAAIALFLQRARTVLPHFELTQRNARVIAEICVRLDGLPLAIELAAARIKVLPPLALLSRLSKRFQVLTGGGQTVPVRQQTLRNTIAWSYDLLEAREQRFFRYLSVFAGGCSLQAAEAVCSALGDSNDGALSVLDGVSSLVDKSLLQQTEQMGEEPRVMMLETIREYGLEALEASGEGEVAQHAHAIYYLALAEETEKEIRDPQQTSWLQQLEQEHGNLRAALQWSLEQGEAGQSMEMALLFSGALANFWSIRGHYSEGRTFLKRVLAVSEGNTTSQRAKALNIAASLAAGQGDYREAEELSQESLALSRRLKDTRNITIALSLLAGVAMTKDNPRTADSLYEEALALSRELGDKKGIADTLQSLGWQAKLQREYTRARALLEESLIIYRELGDKGGIANTLFELAHVLLRAQGDSTTIRSLLEKSHELFGEVENKEGTAGVLNLSGYLALEQGDIHTARSLLEAAFALYKEIGDQHQMASMLYNLAFDVVAQGEFVGAAHLWGKVEAMHEGMGVILSSVDRVSYEQAVATLRTQLGEKDFARAWAEGRDMTPEQLFARHITMHQSYHMYRVAN